MVIMFRGTNISRNNAPQTLAMFAGLTVVKFGRKTLILQLSTNYSVEEYLIGRQIKDQAIQSEINMFDDVGIDAMLRRVETQKIDAKHFSTFCQELYAEPNMFDLALRSKKEDFEEEIVTRERDITKLLGYAKEVYDDIYILVDGKKDKLVGILNKLVDKSFICVPQGNVQEFAAMSDHSTILVTNFDSRSSYDLKSMQKRYGVSEIASIPFDVTFRDFCCSKTLIRFIMTNDKVGPWDDNYAIFSSVSSILEKIHDGELMELSEPAFIFKEKAAKEKSEEKNHYSDQNVRKEVRRKGIFRRRQTVIVHFSETGHAISSTDVDIEDSHLQKKKSGAKGKKGKRSFGRKNPVSPIPQGIDPENYDEFSDLEISIEETSPVESSEEDDEFAECSVEDYEEELGLGEYEEDADDSGEYEEEDDDSEEYEEEDDDSEEYEDEGNGDSGDIKKEEATSTSQSHLKNQQEILDYIRKYCEDRKFILNKTDFKLIRQKSYVLDFFDGWRREYVTNMWKEFESIPVDPHSNVLMDNWQEFPAGTGKEVIKSWFVYNYGADLMNPIMSAEKDKKPTRKDSGKGHPPRKKRKMKHA